MYKSQLLDIESIAQSSKLSSPEIPADRMQRCWTTLLRENIQVPEIECWEYCSQLLHSLRPGCCVEAVSFAALQSCLTLLYSTDSFEQSSQTLHSSFAGLTETQTHVRIESSLLLRFLLIECSVAGRPSWEKIYKSQKFNVESIVSSHSFYTVTQSDLAAVTTLKLRLTISWGRFLAKPLEIEQNV